MGAPSAGLALCKRARQDRLKTKFAGALFEDREMYDTAMATIPIGRHAQPEEMAGTVLYLVSNASSYTNGECVIVDGGLTL